MDRQAGRLPARVRRRDRLRRLTMGLSTLFGRPRGFFIPHRYAATVQPCGYPALEASFAGCVGAFESVLADVERHGERLLRLRGPAPQPRFDQNWFPTLDAAAAYVLVCRARPAHIVEVGSGHSTRFLARAIADEGLETELVCIDPAPRAPLRGLAVRWVEDVVQHAPETCFSGLHSGDILFVDSSHILMPGTDVDWLLNRILPRLAAGVLVHFHDVFLPDPYPESWAWRGYNEQQAIAALLQGRAYDCLFASHYVVTRLAHRLERGVLAELPRPADAPESSLWLVKRGGPSDATSWSNGGRPGPQGSA
jgi:predicted O-methyltransferase YrrM